MIEREFPDERETKNNHFFVLIEIHFIKIHLTICFSLPIVIVFTVGAKMCDQTKPTQFVRPNEAPNKSWV